MYDGYPSRSEEREIQFYKDAEIGHLSSDCIILYSSEIRKLRKDGFIVYNVKPANILDNPKLLQATVSWSNAYPRALPHLVLSYIKGIIDTYPKKYITNFPQELYVIANRANMRK